MWVSALKSIIASLIRPVSLIWEMTSSRQAPHPIARWAWVEWKEPLCQVGCRWHAWHGSEFHHRKRIKGNIKTSKKLLSKMLCSSKVADDFAKLLSVRKDVESPRVNSVNILHHIEWQSLLHHPFDNARSPIYAPSSENKIQMGIQNWCMNRRARGLEVARP